MLREERGIKPGNGPPNQAASYALAEVLPSDFVWRILAQPMNKSSLEGRKRSSDGKKGISLEMIDHERSRLRDDPCSDSP